MLSTCEETWDATASAAAEEDLERYLINDVTPTDSINPNSNSDIHSAPNQPQSSKRKVDRGMMKPRNMAPSWRSRSPPRRWQGPSSMGPPSMAPSLISDFRQSKMTAHEMDRWMRYSREQERYARERDAFNMRHSMNDQWGNRGNCVSDMSNRSNMGLSSTRWEEERFRGNRELDGRGNMLNDRSLFNTGESSLNKPLFNTSDSLLNKPLFNTGDPLFNRSNFNTGEPSLNRPFSTVNELNGDRGHNWNHSQPNMRDPVVEQGRSQNDMNSKKDIVVGYKYRCREDVLHDSRYDPPIKACNNCWKEGHKRPNCPEPPKPYCKNCGRRDVDMSICPRCKDGYPAFLERIQQKKEKTRQKQLDSNVDQDLNEYNSAGQHSAQRSQYQHESENHQSNSRAQGASDLSRLELDPAKAATWAQESVSERENGVMNFMRSIAHLPTETQAMLVRAVYSPLAGPVDDGTSTRCSN